MSLKAGRSEIFLLMCSAIDMSGIGTWYWRVAEEQLPGQIGSRVAGCNPHGFLTDWDNCRSEGVFSDLYAFKEIRKILPSNWTIGMPGIGI